MTKKVIKLGKQVENIVWKQNGQCNMPVEPDHAHLYLQKLLQPYAKATAEFANVESGP